MATISRSALVPYSAESMFDLVDDVDAYEDSLPWCDRSAVEWRKDDEIKATVSIAKGGVHKAFTTINRAQRGKMIEMRLVEGPFRRLDGYWRFQPLGEDGCKISLDLEFEFSNRLVKMAFGKIFNQIANRLVDAFVDRAHDTYGQGRG